VGGILVVKRILGFADVNLEMRTGHDGVELLFADDQFLVACTEENY
jgi:hypothetical protein